MSSILNTAKLIATIKRRAFIPRDQSTFSDTDFLEMATEEVNIGLMDQIITARGDYLTTYIDVPFISEVNEYNVPSRAHGNKLRDVSIVAPDGSIIAELTQISLDQPNDYYTQNAFYMRNNKIVLNKNLIKDSQRLRIYFYMRPNKLVTTDRAATISSIVDSFDVDGITPLKTLTFTSLPSHFTSNIKYDIVGASSPNQIINYNLSPVSINLNTKAISFFPSQVLEVAAGDFVTLAEESIVPNVPTEYHPVIAQRVAVACLEAMGDEQNKQSAERKLAQMEMAVLKIVTNRVEGAPKKIKQRNGTLQSAIYNRNNYRKV